MAKKPGLLKRRIQWHRREALAVREQAADAREAAQKAGRRGQSKIMRFENEAAGQLEASRKWHIKRMKTLQAVRALLKGKRIRRKRARRLREAQKK